MPRSPLALAALATVAVPGLDAFDVRPAGQTGGDVDAAVVLGADGRRWVVRAPRTAAAGAALEAEATLLRALVEHVDADRLPFEVPRPTGFVHLPEGGRAMVHPLLPGRPLPLERLGPGPGLAADVGRAVAALHQLPLSTVEDAGMPVYEAEAYRQRRLAEVDEAARTGRVPGGLLRRWEHALEDVAVWRFQPTVVHGDLSSEHVLCRGERLTGVLGWSDAKVADPADDLAWLLVAAPQEAVDPILEAYNLHRTELRDRHLADRALLAGELALARWLLHGVRTDDPEIVDDATAMLVELDEQTSVEDPPPPPVSGWALPAPADDAGPEPGDAPEPDAAPHGDGDAVTDATPEADAEADADTDADSLPSETSETSDDDLRPVGPDDDGDVAGGSTRA
ncbi:aminoglycoside phosphotransferase [Actinotalea ferrariae CF5-4]|uniref:Aminoglycoside phosphotransferase n=1 Tax=Actinotalea ferrariae CF5-4 TaxID=948458 RepID=A0A021VQF5_9CELL|nr:phosphotransferase [Actinotalea ferrariae]EYR63414.1 aminoglycoside phosphotransferase [Actinotalea ferrariae CF5-4]